MRNTQIIKNKAVTWSRDFEELIAQMNWLMECGFVEGAVPFQQAPNGLYFAWLSR